MMDRLTRRVITVDGCHYAALIGRKTIYNPEKDNKMAKAINRLAAYEDTGLTPDEIKRLKALVEEM